MNLCEYRCCSNFPSYKICMKNVTLDSFITQIQHFDNLCRFLPTDTKWMCRESVIDVCHLWWMAPYGGLRFVQDVGNWPIIVLVSDASSYCDSGHFYSLLILIPGWISNHRTRKMWNEITYPFPNVNGGTVEVWEYISNFIRRFIINVITYPCWDQG